jgi:hypothetical protein
MGSKIGAVIFLICVRRTMARDKPEIRHYDEQRYYSVFGVPRLSASPKGERLATGG